jgi:hypothetical protein
MPGTSDTWKALITRAHWSKNPERAKVLVLRCGLCWRDFSPGPEGAATFTEERGALLIRVCPDCEPMLTLAKPSTTRYVPSS